MTKRGGGPGNHPVPADAVRQRHEDQRARLAARDDEISQLLARSSKTQMVGDRALIKGALSEAEHARLQGLLETAAPKYGEELQHHVEGIRQELESLDGLAVLARYTAGNLIEMWGNYFEPTAHGSEAKVEFLAGLLLTVYQGTPRSEPSAEVMQRIVDAIDDVFDVAFLLNLARNATPQDQLAETRFTSKAQWLSVRGASYEQHARDLAHEIYDGLAREMTERLGFNLDDMIALEAAAVGLIEGRFNALIQAAGEASAQAGKDGAYLAAAQQHDPSVTRELLQQWTFLQVLEEGVTEAFTLLADDLLSKANSLSASALDSLLDRFSIPLGSIASENYISPLGPNPLTDRPLVRSGDSYMLPVPGMLARELATLVEQDMLRTFKNFSTRRAHTLDRLATEYLASMLSPVGAEVRLFYPVLEDGLVKRVECDGLVLFERIAIVVEGKASPLSAQARSGDVARAARDLDRSISEAASQGARARDYLLSGHAVFSDEKGKDILEVESDSLDRVLILNPTLHEMGAFSLHPKRLEALGLRGTEDFWSIYINDLRIIADVVREPAEFIHYWTWRARLPLGSRVEVVDEIDLFATYLLREQFRELEDPAEGVLTLSGSTTDFDAYYMGQSGHGPASKKPRMFNVPAVRTFIRYLSKARPDGWLDAAGVCLDLSLEELAFVDVELKRSRPHSHDSYWSGSFDRCALLILGSSLNWTATWDDFRGRSEPPKRVILADAKKGRGRIVWALESSTA